MSNEKKPAAPIAAAKENPAAPAPGKLNIKFGSPSTMAKDTKTKWLLVGGGFVTISILVGTLMSGDKPPPNSGPRQLDYMNVTPKSITEKSWQVQSQADVQSLAKRLEELEAKNKSLEAKAAQSSGSTGPEGMVFPGMPKPGTSPFNSADFAGALPPPPPPPPAPRGLEAAGDSTVIAPVLETQKQKPIELTPPPLKTGASLLDDSGEEGPEVAATVGYKENKFAGFLSPGSFAQVTLLHGLDAATSQASRSNPQPVLLNVQRNAVLPNYAKYQLKSCFVLASGYGDLSAERAYFRLAQLSCVDKRNSLVLSSPVQGYLVDSDGKLGLRGKVVDRQGAKLAKATLASFAQGLTNVLGVSQGSISSGLLGTTTTLGGADMLKSAGLQGASGATKSLADFFMKEAENIFPIVTVDIGRTGTIVFTEGVSLRWSSTGTTFVKDVKASAAK
jgi:conjugal transfer pilus assembly protein TraB